MNPPAPIVLAALRDSPTGGPVLDTAVRIAEMARGHVEAVHVGEGRAVSLGVMARREGVPYRRLTGRSELALVEVMNAPAVVAMTMGVGTTPTAGHPVSATTLHVISRAPKPVVVVPPHAGPSRRIRRVLVPLEGTASTSEPVLHALSALVPPDVEIDVVHVFTDATLPRMLDRPERDLEMLGRRFLATHCPAGTSLELRSGHVVTAVSEVSREHEVDLVVLSWRQDGSSGRAKVVRGVLGASMLPVLLVPTTARHDAGGADRPRPK